MILVSNMYPTEHEPNYGVFVKRFREQLTLRGIVITQCVLIRGRKKNLLLKIVAYAQFLSSLFLAIVRNKNDVVYIHYPLHASPILLIAYLIGFRPLILINFHGDDLFFRAAHTVFMGRVFLPPVINNAGLVVVPSRFFADEVKARYPKIEPRIFISPSGGVDRRVFHPKTTRRSSDGSLVVGYCSRLEVAKGCRIFLQILGNLKKRGLNVLSIIVGDGSDRGFVEESVQSGVLKSCVKIMGMLDEQRVAEALSQMDILVFPTLLPESLGLVAIESLAVGTPVVASAVGALPEIITDGVTGFLCPPGDVKSYTQAVEWFAHAPLAERDAMSLRGIDAAAKFDSREVADVLVDRLRKVTHGK